MKPFVCLIAAAMFLASSGCLFPEKTENRVRYVDKNAPQITVIWHNLSSDAKNDEDLKEDFARLVEDVDSTNSEIIFGIEKDLIIKDWQIYVENGKLELRVSAAPADDKFEDLTSNGERMLVLDREGAGAVVETNGTLFKTESNYIIVWPETAKEIYWTQRIRSSPPKYDPGLWERWEKNRPKLLKMFEAYKQEKGK